MSKFKVGDIVKLTEYITLEDEDDYTIGQHYTISNIEGDDLYVKEVPDGGYLIGDQLELIGKSASNISYEAPKKYNDNKPMMSLVRPEFIKGLAEGLTYGYTKYGEERGDIQNYLKGDGFYYSTIIDSLERHLNAFKSGVNIDEESGIHHLSLAAANLMFLHTYEHSEKGKDDRVILKKQVD